MKTKHMPQILIFLFAFFLKKLSFIEKKKRKGFTADATHDIHLRDPKRREKPSWLYVIGNKYDRNRYLELTPIAAASREPLGIFDDLSTLG